MTYHKRAVVTRKCEHCRTKFASNHKSRRYCCPSCNTLAWRARQPPAGAPSKRNAAEEPGPVSLALTAQTVGVIALGTMVAQVTTSVLQHLTQGGSPLALVRAEVQQLRQDLGLVAAAPGTPLTLAPVSPLGPPAGRIPLLVAPVGATGGEAEGVAEAAYAQALQAYQQEETAAEAAYARALQAYQQEEAVAAMLRPIELPRLGDE